MLLRTFQRYRDLFTVGILCFSAGAAAAVITLSLRAHAAPISVVDGAAMHPGSLHRAHVTLEPIAWNNFIVTGDKGQTSVISLTSGFVSTILPTARCSGYLAVTVPIKAAKDSNTYDLHSWLGDPNGCTPPATAAR